MAVEGTENVQQFLILAQKSTTELKAICEGLQLDITGSREDLLNRLIDLKAPAQVDLLRPQTIPLRTRDEEGNLISGADKAIHYWRYQIYNAKNNYKEFRVLNSKGELYTTTMRYILCPNTILQKILTEKWYDPRYTAQDEFLALLTSSPEKFNVAIVQRTTKQGKSYIMLHAEAKVA